MAIKRNERTRWRERIYLLQPLVAAPGRGRGAPFGHHQLLAGGSLIFAVKARALRGWLPPGTTCWSGFTPNQLSCPRLCFELLSAPINWHLHDRRSQGSSLPIATCPDPPVPTLCGQRAEKPPSPPAAGTAFLVTPLLVPRLFIPPTPEPYTSLFLHPAFAKQFAKSLDTIF